MRKFLIMPKMVSMLYFGAQDQHFSTFLWICSLDFSEIIPEHSY